MKDPQVKLDIDYESKTSASKKLNSRISEIEKVAKTLKVQLDFKSISAKDLNASLSSLTGSISKLTLGNFNKDLEVSSKYAKDLLADIDKISKTDIGKNIRTNSIKDIKDKAKEEKIELEKQAKEQEKIAKQQADNIAKIEKKNREKRIAETKAYRDKIMAEEKAIANEMASLKKQEEKDNKKWNSYIEKIESSQEKKSKQGLPSLEREANSRINEESNSAIKSIKAQIAEAKALAIAMDKAQKEQEELLNPPIKSIGTNALDDKVDKYSKGIEKLKQSGNISEKAIEDLQNKLNSFTSDTPVNEVKAFERAFSELKAYDGNINTLTNKMKSLQTELLKISSTAIDLKDDRAIKEARELEIRLEEVNKEIDKMSTGGMTSKSKIDKELSSIGRSASELGNSLDGVGTKVSKTYSSLRDFGQLFGVYSVAYASINLVTSAFRTGIDSVMAYDKAMTTLSITMDGFSEVRLDSFGKKLVQLSNDLSTTSDKVMEVATTFANASETMDSILGKTKSATIISNISGLSAQDSVSVIEGAMQQFDELSDKSEKSAMRVADSMTAISRSMGMDFSIGIKGLQEGTEKFGAVANQLNMDLDETLGMIGTVMEKMRISGSEAGTALRSVSARTMRIKGVEGIEKSDFSKAEQALKSFNVEIRDANGGMKDFWDIMNEVYKMKSSGKMTDQEWFNLSEAMGKTICPLVV